MTLWRETGGGGGSKIDIDYNDDGRISVEELTRGANPEYLQELQKLPKKQVYDVLRTLDKKSLEEALRSNEKGSDGEICRTVLQALGVTWYHGDSAQEKVIMKAVKEREKALKREIKQAGKQQEAGYFVEGQEELDEHVDPAQQIVRETGTQETTELLIAKQSGVISYNISISENGNNPNIPGSRTDNQDLLGSKTKLPKNPLFLDFRDLVSTIKSVTTEFGKLVKSVDKEFRRLVKAVSELFDRTDETEETGKKDKQEQDQQTKTQLVDDLGKQKPFERNIGGSIISFPLIKAHSTDGKLYDVSNPNEPRELSSGEKVEGSDGRKYTFTFDAEKNKRIVNLDTSIQSSDPIDKTYEAVNNAFACEVINGKTQAHIIAEALKDKTNPTTVLVDGQNITFTKGQDGKRTSQPVISFKDFVYKTICVDEHGKLTVNHLKDGQNEKIATEEDIKVLLNSVDQINQLPINARLFANDVVWKAFTGKIAETQDVTGSAFKLGEQAKAKEWAKKIIEGLELVSDAKRTEHKLTQPEGLKDAKGKDILTIRVHENNLVLTYENEPGKNKTITITLAHVKMLALKS